MYYYHLLPSNLLSFVFFFPGWELFLRSVMIVVSILEGLVAEVALPPSPLPSPDKDPRNHEI